MKDKILLSGRPGSGKSTLARYLLERYDQPWAGYQTYKYEISPAGPLFALKAFPGEDSSPISCYENGVIRAVGTTFDTLGADCLYRAIEGTAPIILMDEIGRFEKNSPAFLQAVQAVLDSDKTVIAVLKKESLPYLDALRKTPGAILIDLDECTREEARQRLTNLLWPSPKLHWGLTLRLYGSDKSFGPGPMHLLEGVERTGSLHQAAAEMGMAYSKAWKLVKHLEAEWGFPLLESHTGGQGGGKSVLTGQAKELLVRYQAMLLQVEAAAEKSFHEQFAGFSLF